MLTYVRFLALPLVMAVLLASAAGCSAFDTDAARENIRDILQSNREKWAEQDIEDYTYTYTRIGRVGEVAVTVRADTVARVSIGGSPAAEDGVLTVERFFDLVEEAIGAEKENFDAGFDQQLGYPALLLLDYNRTQSGLDELIEVIDFETPDESSNESGRSSTTLSSR